MSSSLLFALLTLTTICPYISQSQQDVIFSAISVLTNGSTIGKSIVGAEWLAIQEINANPTLLSNLSLKFKAFDSEGSTTEALVRALDLIHTKNETHFPILLGCPWSTLSMMINPALGAFQMGQISSGSTSIALSDTSSFPYFYRTIPSDVLQARGIILLCKEFNWTKIAVVYVNDAYGLYLSIGIAELGREEGIAVTTVAFTNDESSTLRNAAVQVDSLDTFIIVFVVHDTVLRSIFDAFKTLGLTGYPYYYIGVDAWLDEGSITSQNASLYAQGAIGTIPWQTKAMSLDTYDNNIQPTINKSMQIYDNMLASWDLYWNNGYHDELWVQDPSSTAIYGYDAMYTIAYALQKYLDRNHSVDDLNITLLNDIILNEIQFVGASGNVLYDELGDRAEGLYALGNVLSDGSIQYFGYFYEDKGNLTLSVEYDKIIWPDDFTDRGMSPQSGIIISIQMLNISPRILIPIYIMTGLSVIITLIYVVLTIIYHDNSVLKAASWKINLVMCLGFMTACASTIVYGIDERMIDVGPTFNFLCNFRLWLWMMSYTLLFMPLFTKTYRLSQIFSEILEKRVLTDKHLLYIVLGCVVVDVSLLTIYTSIEALQRMSLEGHTEPVDALQLIQYEYGSCESEHGIQFIFYAMLSLWKVMESLFGIYCALSVSRVGRQELSQFDETTQQLLAIGFLITALCVAIPVAFLGPAENPSYFFGVVGILILSVGNVTTTLNMFPRLLAVIRGKTDEYTQSPEQKVEMLIRKQLKRMSIKEEMWRKYGMESKESAQSSRQSKEEATEATVNSNSKVRLAIPTQSGYTFTVTDSNDNEEPHIPIDEVPTSSPIDEDVEIDVEPQLNKKQTDTPPVPIDEEPAPSNEDVEVDVGPQLNKKQSNTSINHTFNKSLDIKEIVEIYDQLEDDTTVKHVVVVTHDAERVDKAS